MQKEKRNDSNAENVKTHIKAEVFSHLFDCDQALLYCDSIAVDSVGIMYTRN